MRFFDCWWEHVPTIARLTPLFIGVLGVVLQHPMDYYWE